MTHPEPTPSWLRERYPGMFTDYDRQSVWQTLTTALDVWHLKQQRRQRYRYMCRLTLDTLDTCTGQTLHDRWAYFEACEFPKWYAGERQSVLGNTWRVGINTLIVARLVLPGWPVLFGTSMQQFITWLPESDSLNHQQTRLQHAVASLSWAKHPIKRSLAVDHCMKLLLVRGYQALEEIHEEDLATGTGPDGTNYLGVGTDILDGALCALGVFARTPRRNSSRRRREEHLSIPDIVAKYAVPEPFHAITLLYLETAVTRLNWTLGYLQQVCLSIATFWQYLRQHFPEIGDPSQVLPIHGKAFVDDQLGLARRSMPDGSSDSLPGSTYGKLVNVRTFFSDVCQWATEPGSPFAVYAPRTTPLSRQDLSRREFEQARKRVAERLKATIFDLERELPKIRAYALQHWVQTEGQLQAEPDNVAATDAEADAFWNWALLELLVQSGLRVEEATELTTLDVLKRRLPDGRLYYLLHVKPSKFDRARLIPIGDGLGRVIAEMMRHIKRFYHTDTVPFCDRWDYTGRKKAVRAPYLLQGLGHPSVISDEVIRRRLRILSQRAGAKASDGSPLILHPHDCRRMFATEHLNNNVPVHVIQALLGHATIDTVMVYAKLYPTRLVEEYRKAVRGVYNAIHGQESLRNPSAEEWAAFEASCSLRDMGTHLCALPTGEHCPRGLVCLGCIHAQPKKSAAPVFRRMLASHERELAAARQRGEPAGQVAARELEVERIRSALRRAEELAGDVAAAIEAAAERGLGASAELREED